MNSVLFFILISLMASHSLYTMELTTFLQQTMQTAAHSNENSVAKLLALSPEQWSPKDVTSICTSVQTHMRERTLLERCQTINRLLPALSSTPQKNQLHLIRALMALHQTDLQLKSDESRALDTMHTAFNAQEIATAFSETPDAQLFNTLKRHVNKARLSCKLQKPTQQPLPKKNERKHWEVGAPGAAQKKQTTRTTNQATRNARLALQQIFMKEFGICWQKKSNASASNDVTIEIKNEQALQELLCIPAAADQTGYEPTVRIEDETALQKSSLCIYVDDESALGDPSIWSEDEKEKIFNSITEQIPCKSLLEKCTLAHAVVNAYQSETALKNIQDQLVCLILMFSQEDLAALKKERSNDVIRKLQRILSEHAITVALEVQNLKEIQYSLSKEGMRANIKNSPERRKLKEQLQPHWNKAHNFTSTRLETMQTLLHNALDACNANAAVSPEIKKQYETFYTRVTNAVRAKKILFMLNSKLLPQRLTFQPAQSAKTTPDEKQKKIKKPESPSDNWEVVHPTPTQLTEQPNGAAATQPTVQITIDQEIDPSLMDTVLLTQHLKALWKAQQEAVTEKAQLETACTQDEQLINATTSQLAKITAALQTMDPVLKTVFAETLETLEAVRDTKQTDLQKKQADLEKLKTASALHEARAQSISARLREKLHTREQEAEKLAELKKLHEQMRSECERALQERSQQLTEQQQAYATLIREQQTLAEREAALKPQLERVAGARESLAAREKSGG